MIKSLAFCSRVFVLSSRQCAQQHLRHRFYSQFFGRLQNYVNAANGKKEMKYETVSFAPCFLPYPCSFYHAVQMSNDFLRNGIFHVRIVGLGASNCCYSKFSTIFSAQIICFNLQFFNFDSTEKLYHAM